MSGRVFAVTLHGLGRYYLEPLLEQGRLPNLRRILDEGASGGLLSPYPVSAATWVTMFTGQSVGVHGALDYVQVDARSYHGTEARLADVEEFRDQTIFSILSRRGRRVAALFNPMTYPPWEVDGVMVSGFPLPDERRPPVWPPELSGRIGTVVPDRLLSLRYEDKDAVERYLETAVARVEEITVGLWNDDDFDLMYTCVAAPDIGHHYFWSRDDPDAFERLHRVYERVDATVGRYAGLVGDDDWLVLFSDHGGGPAPTRRFNVNRWLVETGLLVPRSRLAERLGLVRVVNRLIEAGRRLGIHEKLRRLLRGPVRQGVLSLTRNDAFFDWSRSRAYGVDFFFPLVGVEVNLEGRQPRGIVEPGAGYEELRARLVEELAALRDPATGARVCRRVCRREEMFHGPYLERIPDVVAELDLDYDGRIQLDRRVFDDNELRWDYPFLGYHSREGFFAVRGPGIEAGRRLPENDMIDLAPTLLTLLDVPIPDSMEGRPFPFLHDRGGVAGPSAATLDRAE